jgi:hypothetical protein
MRIEKEGGLLCLALSNRAENGRFDLLRVRGQGKGRRETSEPEAVASPIDEGGRQVRKRHSKDFSARRALGSLTRPTPKGKEKGREMRFTYYSPALNFQHCKAAFRRDGKAEPAQLTRNSTHPNPENARTTKEESDRTAQLERLDKRVPSHLPQHRFASSLFSPFLPISNRDPSLPFHPTHNARTPFGPTEPSRTRGSPGSPLLPPTWWKEEAPRRAATASVSPSPDPNERPHPPKEERTAPH